MHTYSVGNKGNVGIQRQAPHFQQIVLQCFPSIWESMHVSKIWGRRSLNDIIIASSFSQFVEAMANLVGTQDKFDIHACIDHKYEKLAHLT